MPDPKKISIITLGCAKNQNDTENLTGLLSKGGHRVGGDVADADAVVVHTCSFIEAAKRESVETILSAAESRKKGAKLFVTGCMVQQHGKELFDEIPEADAFLGTGQLAQVSALLSSPRSRFLDRRDPGGLTDPDAERVLTTKGASATLRVSEGCSHPCSFCVIPRLRGGLKSRPPEVIVGEARRLAEQGVEELVIIGQDTGDWGRDLPDAPQLAGLLRRLRGVSGIRWIRLMYLHPHSCTDDLIGVFAESPDLFPYLDMPLQHIDSEMLSRMKRYLSELEIRALIDKIRSRAPSLSLRTTFIVGYPGETEAQFERLNAFVNEGHFDYLGAFPYSKEESTPAALESDQIDVELKNERHQALMATYFGAAYQKAQKRLGTVEKVIIEETEGDTVTGRTRREAPEIDAVVRMPRSAARAGRFADVRLTGYDAYEFSAEPI